MFLCSAAGSVVKTFEVTPESITHQRTLNPHNADITSVQYNHNGRILASSSVKGGICLNVASSGEMLSQFFYPGDTPEKKRLNALQFSSGSRFLASGGNDGSIQLWDLKTQEVMQTYNISSSAVTSVAFSGYKDEFIVGGTFSGAIYICDVQTAETVGSLTVDPAHGGHQVMAIQASLHPNSRQTLGSTYSDGSVRVWNLTTGQLTAEFVRQHEAPATSLALSSVSKVLLASGGLDGRVIFYDTLQRKELRSLDLEQPVSSLALCADGKTFAVGTTTGEVHLYDLRGAITPMFSSLVHEISAVLSLEFSPHATDIVTSPGKGENLNKNSWRSLHLQGMGSPSRNGRDLLRVPSSPTLSSTQSATRSKAVKPSMLVSPRKQSNTPQNLNPPITKISSKLATTHAFADERPQSGPSLLSSMCRQSLKPAKQVSDDTEIKVYSSKQADFGIAMRLKIQRLREQIELRRQEDIDQLSTMLETLMDRFDVVVEENRSLRQENDWLKSHVLES